MSSHTEQRFRSEYRAVGQGDGAQRGPAGWAEARRGAVGCWWRRRSTNANRMLINIGVNPLVAPRDVLRVFATAARVGILVTISYFIVSNIN